MKHKVAFALHFVLASCLLTACEKHRSFQSVLTDNTGGSQIVPDSPASYILITAGQSNMVGIEREGMSQVLQELPQNIGIKPIQCAVGGSTITQWEPGAPLYEQCIARAKAENLPVLGVLFYQGEQEAVLGVNDWGNRFMRFANGIRVAFENQNIPIVHGRISNQHPANLFPFRDQIRNIQSGITLSKNAWISTDSVSIGPDSTHFTSSGYQTLGTLFGRSLKNLL